MAIVRSSVPIRPTDFNIGMIYRLIFPCHKLRAVSLLNRRSLNVGSGLTGVTVDGGGALKNSYLAVQLINPDPTKIAGPHAVLGQTL